MASDEYKKNRIMEYSFRRFTTSGVPHVTMDDISRGVGIGKGTLYKFFPSKEALLLETISFVTSRIEKQVKEVIMNDKLNPVEKLGLVFRTVGERIAKINPSVISYLERSMPEVFDKIIEVREGIIMNNLVKIFEEGKGSGYFNPDMDPYFTVQMIIGAANHITEERVLTTLNDNMGNILTKLTSTILYGCLTEEGRKISFSK